MKDFVKVFKKVYRYSYDKLVFITLSSNEYKILLVSNIITQQSCFKIVKSNSLVAYYLVKQ